MILSLEEKKHNLISLKINWNNPTRVMGQVWVSRVRPLNLCALIVFDCFYNSYIHDKYVSVVTVSHKDIHAIQSCLTTLELDKLMAHGSSYDSTTAVKMGFCNMILCYKRLLTPNSSVHNAPLEAM